MYHYDNESCNIVHNSQMSKILFHYIERISVYKFFQGKFKLFLVISLQTTIFSLNHHHNGTPLPCSWTGKRTGCLKSEVAWPQSTKCKDKIKTVQIMVEEGGSLTKVDVLWSRDFSKQRNRRQKRKRCYSCPLGSSREWRILSPMQL